MLYSIEGMLVYKDETLAVVETGGLALELFISQTSSQNIGEIGSRVKLFAKLIVRENEMFLVGFLSMDERRLYENLLTVSGIGPKHGLKILSELTPSQIRCAIMEGDTAMLGRVKGIGAKTAERIILELRDKIKKLQLSDSGGKTTGGLEKKKMEILLAMRVLGYGDNESRRIIESVFAQNEGFKDKAVEDIIKVILSGMAK